MSADQTILAVDDAGGFLRYVPKADGHAGDGVRHLAIAVLLTRGNGDILVQLRRHQLFDNVWDLTGATHPLHLADGRDETLAEAADRCMQAEYGVAPGGIAWRDAGTFNYFAKDGERCENERCHLLVGKFDGEVSPSEESAYDAQWWPRFRLMVMSQVSPQALAPWALEGIRLLQAKGFFPGI